MFRVFDRCLDALTFVVKWTMVSMASCIFTIILVTVITRYVYGFVFSWSEEVPRYFLVWIALLGTALAVERRDHIGFDAIFKKFPPLGQRILQYFLDGGMAFVALVMFYYGVDFVRQFGSDLMESIPLTNFWLYIAMPISGGIILLYLIRSEIRRWKRIEASSTSA
jgi:TRAP-type transport system small permease protein